MPIEVNDEDVMLEPKLVSFKTLAPSIAYAAPDLKLKEEGKIVALSTIAPLLRV